MTSSRWIVSLLSLALGLAGCDGTPDTPGPTETDAGVTTTDASSTAEDAGAVEAPRILNGSFERNSLEPGCYDNLSNAVFSEAVEDVTAFGAYEQTDLYGECYGSRPSDGAYQVALGASAGQSDAIAMALSGPILGGQRYRLRFVAEHGDTGGATSTNVLVGVSDTDTAFGETVGETGLLPSDPTELTVDFTAAADGAYLTLQVEVDGDLGWAMIDDLRIEPL